MNTKESRERRALRREARNANEDLADTMEEIQEFAEEYTGELKPLGQEVASLVSAMERYNRASGQRHNALAAHAERMGIKPYAGIKDLSAAVEKLTRQIIARQVPIQPQAMDNPEFFGDRFYVTSGNIEQIHLYECTGTPMNFNLAAGALYV